MARTSVSSDSTSASSTISDSTTVCSYTKDTAAAPQQQQQQRRGMRQRVRDVVSDLGDPPTKRQDLKDGKRTQNHVDVGPVGTVLMGSSTV